MADNVYSNARIISKNDDIQKYELGNFVNGNVETNIVEQAKVVLNDNGINGRPDPLLDEFKKDIIKRFSSCCTFCVNISDYNRSSSTRDTRFLLGNIFVIVFINFINFFIYPKTI